MLEPAFQDLHLTKIYQPHGDPTEYERASVPASSDTRWGPAPSGDIIGFGSDNASRLPSYSCGFAVDYHYFQTFVSVPVGGSVSKLTVDFSGIDDGARISVYNDRYPAGVIDPTYVYLGGTATANLASYMVVGQNRIVITQVDDCATGNNLRVAKVVVDGSVVPPAPVNTAPSISVTGPVEGAVYGVGQAPPADCLVSDVEDGQKTVSPVVTLSGPRSALGLGTATVSCRYQDAGGLTATALSRYTVVDKVAPTVSVPVVPLSEATSTDGATVSFPAATAVDDVDGTITPTCSPASGSTFPIGVTRVTCSAADLAGNQGTGTLDVKVADTTAPVLAAKSLVAAATSSSGARVEFPVSTTDAVDGAGTANCTPASSSTFPLGETTVTCTSTDRAGNSSTTDFTVTVQDRGAPVVDGQSPFAVEATGPSGAPVVLPVVAASDDVDGTLRTSCSPGSGVFAMGNTTVTCVATDRAGNTGSNTYSVAVVDTTAPELSVEDVTAEATSSLGAVTTYPLVHVADAVSPGATAVCDHLSGAQFPLGDTLVSCAATDDAGNTGSASFHVTVRDTTAPSVLTPAAGDPIEATSPSGAAVAYGTVRSADAVDGSGTASCSPVSGAVFPLGATTVSCTATDVAGNPSTSSFPVVVRDTVAPDLFVSPNLLVSATGPDGAKADFVAATAQDDVDLHPKVSCDRLSGSVFPLGTTTVSCKAVDASGNSRPDSFTVVVQDKTAPVITVPAAQLVEATGPAGAPVAWTVATASDDVDGVLVPVCDRANGGTFALGTTMVSCSVQDHAGNAATNRFSVTVLDRTAPTVKAPSSTSTTASGPRGAVVTYGPGRADDLVDGTRPVTCDHASGSTFPLGRTTVTCSASDLGGNTGTASFTVDVSYGFAGFLQPVEGKRTFKLGSTIPVKFALSGASAGVRDADARLQLLKVGGSSAGASAVAVSSGAANVGDAFRYTDGQYLFNLSTKDLSVGTWRLRIDLQDGVAREIEVELK